MTARREALLSQLCEASAFRAVPRFTSYTGKTKQDVSNLNSELVHGIDHRDQSSLGLPDEILEVEVVPVGGLKISEPDVYTELLQVVEDALSGLLEILRCHAAHATDSDQVAS